MTEGRCRGRVNGQKEGVWEVGRSRRKGQENGQVREGRCRGRVRGRRKGQRNWEEEKKGAREGSSDRRKV